MSGRRAAASRPGGRSAGGRATAFWGLTPCHLCARSEDAECDNERAHSVGSAPPHSAPAVVATGERATTRPDFVAVRASSPSGHRKPASQMMLAGRTSAIALFVAGTAGLDNGLGRTPLLGFNSWNVFACEVNETVMRDTMDAFVTLGLRDAGYDTVSVDDCEWSAASRRPATSAACDRARGCPSTQAGWAHSRAADGTIQADPVTFPSGMASLAAFAAARGLKFGTCARAR